jgi:hypothetical protein
MVSSRQKIQRRPEEDEMKKHGLGVVGAAVLVAVLGVLSVSAEAGSLHCAVPFAFQVGDRSLPRGDYSVETEQAKILIRGVTTGALAIGNPLEKTGNNPKLVFHRYGSEYILSEVWTGSTGRQLSPSRREKELKSREMAAFETVVIPLS